MYEAFIHQTHTVIITSMSRFTDNSIEILLIVREIFVSGTFTASINHFLSVVSVVAAALSCTNIGHCYTFSTYVTVCKLEGLKVH